MEYVVEAQRTDGTWYNAVAHPFFAKQGFDTKKAADSKKVELEADHPDRMYRVREV